MYESKLIEHLKVLNDAEFSDFLRFVKAMTEYEKDIPEETYTLVKYIYKYINNNDADKLSRELVYKHVYSKQEWKNGRLDKLMSATLKVFKNYVDFKLSDEKSEIESLIPMTKFYRKRELHKLFELNIKQLKKCTQEIELYDTKQYWEKYSIENEIFEYQSQYNTKKESLNIPETIIALDYYYMTQRLDLTLVALVQNQFIPFDSSLESENTINDVLKLTSNSIYKENTLIQLYKKAIQLQLEKEISVSDIIFKEFNTLLENNSDKVNFNKLSLFCTIARIYSTRQYNKGRNEFLIIILELFKKHLTQKVLYVDDNIRASTLQNIISISLKLKEFEFAKSFLEVHKDRISGTLQPNLVWEYNMAFYYFEVGKLKEALDKLPNYLDLEDFSYILSARRLEIKIHFELDNNRKYDMVGNKIDAFKNFLFENKKNNRIHELMFNINNDFTDLLRQMRNTLKSDKEKICKLKTKIEQNQAIAEREWLLAKLNAL